MGYSEVYCHICGVSFRIGRLQTLEEVKNPDTAAIGAEFVSSYIALATDNLWSCNNEGDDCLVHISPVMEAAMRRTGSEPNDGDEAMGDAEDDDDDDYVDTSSDTSEPYEYQSPDEGGPEEGDDTISDTPTYARLWQHEMQRDDTNPVGNIRTYVDGHVRRRQREELGEEEDTHYLRSDLRDIYFQHIPGPNCSDKGGYHSKRISLAEMRGCTVVQALVPRMKDWQSEPGDETFEKDAVVGVFLSGLCDDMPSRDWNSPTCFPVRHGVEVVAADNFVWADEDQDRAAMPFHPACFEVFKRASLQRTGRVDVAGLARWFKLEATYDDFHKNFPRSAAVGRANDQWWVHVKGDEHLVANPCYVPAWDKAIASGAVRVKTASPGVFDFGDEAAALGSDRFARLSDDVRYRILKHLVSSRVDIANLRLASRAFRQLPQRLFRDLLLHHRPWLWEAWCDLSYSHWSNTSAKALKKQEEKWQARQEIIDHSLGVLNADDPDNEAAMAALRAQADEITAERAEACVSVAAGRLAENETDWYGVYNWLQRPKPKWPKGLRNRRRIWQDCGYILDRIELGRREGRISADAGGSEDVDMLKS